MLNIEYDRPSDTIRMERKEDNKEDLSGESYLGHGIFISLNKISSKISRARIPFFRKTYLRFFEDKEVLLELEEEWLERNLPREFSEVLIKLTRRCNKRVF